MSTIIEHDEQNIRLQKKHGRVYLSGTQALIRLMVDQVERDRKAGMRTGGFVTGYPGSPLGGLEGALKRASDALEGHGIKHVPGQNEELAATTLMGTQMLDEHPHPDFDGVVGYWYGKGPGVDRASDAFKHGNFAGTSRNGAVVVLSGEDHEAKSSTVPYQQEFAFEHFGMPIVQPANTLEILTFGAHAIALSRYSGCWVAMKLTAPVCDSGETIDLERADPDIRLPGPAAEGASSKTDPNFRFFPIVNIARERDLYYSRHAAVRAYARANGLDQITVRTDRDRIGIISSGKSFVDTREALLSLGYDDDALRAAGIRLLKIGLLYPLEEGVVKEFAAGLDQIIVVEEKRDFLERQVARAICNLPRVPKLLGKRDLKDDALFPIEGGMDFDLIATVLAKVIRTEAELPASAHVRLDQLLQIEARSANASMKRLPTYCSGCPHNIGTKLAPGHIAWGAPGCHVFAAIMPEPTRRIEAVTQFGGEGLPWIGLSPFTSRDHIVQNVGDGSLFHSSYLNIRFAVAAKIKITFKILYNGAIANTGGQPPIGAKSIPELTQLLTVEGVKRIVLVTKEPRAYRGAALSPMVEIRRDDEIEVVQEELSKTAGVTVLIYDGQCANEQRRRRKRALLPKTSRFTLVNEEVCENCGHCGKVSSCMSLHKVDTEFGKKTAIHQSSCNQDMTCIRAECPSFVTVDVQPGKVDRRKPPLPQIDSADLPAVTLPAFERNYQICMPGVGGTGVITLNAILSQAATLDGLRVISFDLTGSAQKWGPVLSSLIVTRDDTGIVTNHVGRGQADLYLALDLLTASEPANLGRCLPGKTAAIINDTVLPTGEMVRNVDLTLYKKPMLDAMRACVDLGRSHVVDAGKIAELELGDYMLTNMVMLGAAFQAGLVPISADSIEQAIRHNNTQVKQNIAAFRLGRLRQIRELTAPERVEPQLADRAAELALTHSGARSLAQAALIEPFRDLKADLRDKLSLRIEDLISYQNEAYATRYADIVRTVREKEAAISGKADLPLTRAVIENLHKLMAYKDEYEVARLHIQRTFRQRVKSMFDGPVKLYFHLQPPLLRHFGMSRKVRIGEWFVVPLSILHHCRFLRSTPFDPFGYAKVRRVERHLVGWYIEALERLCSQLRSDNAAAAVLIARLPEEIRGYEEIKLASIDPVLEKAERLLAEFAKMPPADQKAASAAS